MYDSLSRIERLPGPVIEHARETQRVLSVEGVSPFLLGHRRRARVSGQSLMGGPRWQLHSMGLRVQHVLSYV